MKQCHERRNLPISSITIRVLSSVDLHGIQGGQRNNSGSAGGLSVTCAPTKNGDGSGCVTGLMGDL